MATKCKLLITLKGGFITEILSTSNDVEVTVVDEDADAGQELVYYRQAPDKIIPPEEYENDIEEYENKQLNAEDEE